MENAEEIMHCLEEFSKMKPKDIPHELDAYLNYVAKTGDPVFKWSIIKCLFREKMLNVITDFYESTLGIELPPCPNVDRFNYEGMKATLLEKLDSFHGAPFTVQRISELLTNPRKEYNRADKFMRAIEKNILVGSTREPGRYAEVECDSSDPSFNGVPEVNNIKMGPSGFTCNDLGDSSESQAYEEVNCEVRPFAGIGSLGDKAAIGPSSVEHLQGQLDSLPAEPSLLIEDKIAEFGAPQDEKENDGVICSTPSLQLEQSKDESKSVDVMDVQETHLQSEQNEDSNSLSLDDVSSLQVEASSLDQSEISQPETPLFSGEEKNLSNVEDMPLFDSSNDDLNLNASQVQMPGQPQSPTPVPTTDSTETQPASPSQTTDSCPEPPIADAEKIVKPTQETSVLDSALELTDSTSPAKDTERQLDRDTFPSDVCFSADDDPPVNEPTSPHDHSEQPLDTPPATVVTENGQAPCRDTIIHTTSPFTEKTESQPMDTEDNSSVSFPPSEQDN